MWFYELIVELSCVLRFIATLVAFAFRRVKQISLITFIPIVQLPIVMFVCMILLNGIVEVIMMQKVEDSMSELIS